jgi:hypothetical protein
VNLFGYTSKNGTTSKTLVATIYEPELDLGVPSSEACLDLNCYFTIPGLIFSALSKVLLIVDMI